MGMAKIIFEGEGKLQSPMLMGKTPNEWVKLILSGNLVEVVRCKDCKYWKEEKDFGMFCTHWGSTLAESQAEDFCSYGERREGE